MAKLTLNPISSGFASNTALNTNNDLIETALENTLSRNGTSPNQMGADFDMNGYNIINQGNPITVTGLVWEGPWITGVSYSVGDIIQSSGTAYICIVAHTSGTFTTDLAALKWQIFTEANLPSQVGNSGKYLKTDSVNPSWSSIQDTDVTFTPSGTGAVATTVQSKLREFVSVKDFGATGDGATDDTAAILLALATGKSIFFPSGTYVITDRLLVTVAGTCIQLSANTTLLMDSWTYPGSQVPFGNSIHITANNCSVVGCGASSLIQNTGGSDANGIGVLQAYGTYIGNIRIDGGKSGVTAIVDDTFQSGIMIINYTPTSSVSASTIVENCVIENWTQYGINVYGDLCRNITITGNKIRDNGKTGEALSVGAGIVLTRGISDCGIYNNAIYNNKQHGIFQSSAGGDSSGFVVDGNIIYGNGQSGISFTEESAFGSVVAVGTKGVQISNNSIHDNVVHGISLGTYDSVGYQKNVNVTGNTITDNGSYGVLVATNNHATNRTSNVCISSNVITGNTDYGIGIAANNNSVLATGNVVIDNAGGNILNAGLAGCAAYGNITSATTSFAQQRFTVASSAVAVSCPADTTEDVLATITIPANAMGSNGSIVIDTSWSYTNSANNKLLNIRFSGVGGTLYEQFTATTTVSARVSLIIQNRGATNSQVGSQGQTSLVGANSATAILTSAVDTTAATTIVISGQKASAGETLTLERYSVELIPG